MSSSSLPALSLVVACSCLAACSSSADTVSELPPDASDASQEASPDASVDTASDVAPTDTSIDTAPADSAIVDSSPTDTASPDSTTGLDSATADSDASLPPQKINCKTGPMSPYLGDIHTHTSYSDGIDLPADMFKKAREVVGLDYTFITDHSSKLTDVEFADCKKSASNYTTNGTFVGDCGFELNIRPVLVAIGHANVFFTDTFFAHPKSFDEFYAKLATCTGCIGQINHPASVAFSWSDETYSATADPTLALAETNGNLKATAIAKYVSLLDKGWHLSPSSNTDTHELDPGADGHRTGVFTTSLDLKSIRQAMLDRRSFASTAGNGSSLSLQTEGCWMGARLQHYQSVNVELQALDSDVGFSDIQLVSKTGKILKTLDCKSQKNCTQSLTLKINPASDAYVFAIANRTDNKWLMSAPIWLEE